MITISSAVQQILSEDGFVIEAMQRGLLNVSAYAKHIHKAVEVKTMKPVKKGSIVVALTRIAHNLKSQKEFNPKVEISSMSITTNLSEVTFETTQANVEKLMSLEKKLIKDKDFFTVTEGLHEITIILSSDSKDKVLSHFDMSPKVVIDDLVAISVRFSTYYIDVPNTIYSLVGALAVRNINLMEIVSTYTELTFVVFRKEMDTTIQALNLYSRRQE